MQTTADCIEQTNATLSSCSARLLEVNKQFSRIEQITQYLLGNFSESKNEDRPVPIPNIKSLYEYILEAEHWATMIEKNINELRGKV